MNDYTDSEGQSSGRPKRQVPTDVSGLYTIAALLLIGSIAAFLGISQSRENALTGEKDWTLAALVGGPLLVAAVIAYAAGAILNSLTRRT